MKKIFAIAIFACGFALAAKAQTNAAGTQEPAKAAVSQPTEVKPQTVVATTPEVAAPAQKQCAGGGSAKACCKKSTEAKACCKAKSQAEAGHNCKGHAEATPAGTAQPEGAKSQHKDCQKSCHKKD
ncbi:MAG: hypothetical protein JNL57_11235 [Bacteroidetes bacterium]|nr:hypothetical protein [Bacteroidota bacterium]